MNKRLGIAALGGVGVLAVGAAVVPAALATPSSTSHTLHFTALTQANKSLSRTTFTQDEKDVRNGKVIGYDVLLITSTSPSTATGRVAFASKGGFLYGRLTFDFNSPTVHGKIIGGTGSYRGATGTVLGKNLNKAGTRTAVTLKFTT